MSKRYQVFVSSTYADLKEERRHIIQALMELDCIPAGMEMFPAADEEQFEFIKRVIDDCDYYLLVIGGRYGSLSPDGISFTEKEFDYAVGREVPVIALLHEAPELIALGKSELDPRLRDMLGAFRTKVMTGRLVKHWKSAEELPGLVALSVSNSIKLFPALGWVRATGDSNESLLLQLNEVRRENAELSARLAGLESELVTSSADASLAGLDEPMQFRGTGTKDGKDREWTTTATWREVFGYIAPYLIKHPSDATVKRVLDEALSQKSGTSLWSARLPDQVFQTIGVQLRALGLVKMTYSKTVQGGMALFWTATKLGDELTYKIRTVRTKKS